MAKPLIVVALLFLASASMRLSASVPVGVYAIVDKVVFEPGDAEPQHVQIWGAFATWDEMRGNRYRKPERGYLYYSCSKEQLRLCRNEWTDLKAVAGTGQVVGFGSRSLLSGRVRATHDRASVPDAYPIQFGVVELGSPRGGIFDELKALTRAQ